MGKKENEVARRARAAFDKYASLDSPDLPSNPTSALQVQLARWQARNFGAGDLREQALGVGEEVGELAEALVPMVLAQVQAATGRLQHATLKHAQGIRGYHDRDKLRAAAADAMADATIYMFQLATALRLDLGTAVKLTAANVMGRDWVADREGGDQSASSAQWVIEHSPMASAALRPGGVPGTARRVAHMRESVFHEARRIAVAYELLRWADEIGDRLLREVAVDSFPHEDLAHVLVPPYKPCVSTRESTGRVEFIEIIRGVGTFALFYHPMRDKDDINRWDYLLEISPEQAALLDIGPYTAVNMTAEVAPLHSFGGPTRTWVGRLTKVSLL